MGTLLLFWFFILGAVVGSFLNVVAYRLDTGRSVTGRSRCTSCAVKLPWYALIPMLSYIAQGGRCRTCTARITARYLVVELLTAVLFAVTANVFWDDPVRLVLTLGMSALLVVIGIHDIRHTLIPDSLVIYLTALAFGYVLWDPSSAVVGLPPASAVSGGVLAAAFFFSLWYFSRGRWMGLGDAKLAFPLGLVLGAWGSVSMLVFSFWIGAAVSIVIIAVQRMRTYAVHTRAARGQRRLRFLSTPLTMKSEVPFAPFLILAFFAVHFWDIHAFSLIAALTALLSS